MADLQEDAIPKAKKPSETDQSLLALVSDERKQSIGFDNDAVLNRAREKALNYYKGEMPDIAYIEGRSSAISTDIADAVETILPDLIEIFTSEDAAAFLPRGEEDEEAAEQETDVINHVFYNENDGFMILYSVFKDALLSKTGVFKVYSEEYDESEEFEGKAPGEAAAIINANGEAALKDKVQAEDGTWSFRVERKGKKACVRSVAPEDFTVSKDTVSLRNTPYCAHRSRLRAYELLEDGYPRDKVDKLTAYGAPSDEVDRARDTAGEDDKTVVGQGDRRLVEVIEHYIRRKGKYTRVVTNADETILLEREEVSRNPFSAVTPYPTTHRFYGESVADRLMEIQRIRTALTRIAMDSAYFALNGRSQINMNLINEWTIPDLLTNAPNMPVRTQGEGAVTPLATAPLGFDPFSALEYFSTQAEQRTGIVRNAQGLNPDTLHDTATGAMEMVAAAQKRVRLIARILAETGIKDMFLNLHALIRETASGPMKARLRNKWVEFDPTSWGARSDMTIEIGVGASGKEAQVAMLQAGMQTMQEIVALQGGANGPMVTLQNAYNMTKRFYEKGLGFKNADLYLTDPSAPPKPGDPPPEPPAPDPALVEMQGKQALAQAELEGRQALAQADLEGKQALAQMDMQMRLQETQARLQMESESQALKLENDRESAALQAQLKRDEAAANIAAKQAQTDAEIALKERQIAAELELKRQQIAAEIELKREGIRVNAEVSVATSDVGVGGEGG